MKHFTFLKTMLLAVVMLAGSVSVWGQEIATLKITRNNFPPGALVYNSTDIWSATTSEGDVISGEGDLYSTASQTTLQTKNSGVSTMYHNTIAIPGPITKITLTCASGTTRTYTVYMNSTTVITSKSEGIAKGTLAPASGGSKSLLLDSNEDLRFFWLDLAGGASFLTSIEIEYEVVSPCTTSDLSFTNETVSKKTADAPFTITPISLNETTPITYTSSEETVATVDAATGEITIVGAGTTTITANQEAGTHNGVEYCVGTSSYELTVTSTEPSITVDPVALVFSTTVGAEPAEDMIEVTGVNLKADIAVSIIGADAALFSVDAEKVTTTDGNASDVLVVTYTPTASGTHTATLTLSSTGAEDKTVELSGTASLAAPVATDATSINSNGFTANWDAVEGATEYELNIYTKTMGEAPELVNNGGFEAGDKTNWAGTNIASMTIQSESPHNGGYYLSRTGGDNARVEQIVSVEIGKTYIFSFWYNNYDASNTNGLKNYSIQGTSGTNYIDDSTPAKLPAASIWTKYEKEFTATEDEFKISIRAYQLCDIDDISLKTNGSTEVITPITGSPFIVNTTSHNVTGLANTNTYFYTVKAINDTSESPLSNEAGPISLVTTGLDNSSINNTIWTAQGKVMVNATAGDLVEIYNVSGQKLVSRLAADGLNSIDVATKGVLIVKAGNQTAKVVL